MRKRRATRRPKPLRLVNRSLPAPGSPGGPHRRGTLRMPGIIADAQGTEANSSSFLAGSSRSLLSVRLFCHFATALFGYTPLLRCMIVESFLDRSGFAARVEIRKRSFFLAKLLLGRKSTAYHH